MNVRQLMALIKQAKVLERNVTQAEVDVVAHRGEMTEHIKQVALERAQRTLDEFLDMPINSRSL